MVEFIQIVGFFICFGLLILTIILSKWKEGTEEEPSELDNPLLLTIKAMETELAELHENNIHMKRIAQLEKQIQEARAHAETLSKLSEEYGSTMEEVGESIAGGIGGRSAVHTVTPISKKIDDEATRQNTALFRTYTRQAGWSSYYDVELK